MAKRTGKKTKPKSMKDLQSAFPELSQEDQVAKAKLALDQEIISIYAKSITNINEKERLENELKDVEKKLDGIDDKILEAVGNWFPNKGGIGGLYLSKVYLDGLKDIAANRGSGGRQKWDNAAMVKAIDGVAVSQGYAEGAKVMKALKVANIDLLVNRLSLGNGELFRVDDKGNKTSAAIKDGKVTKIKGKRSKYLVNVEKVVERLKK